MLTLNDKGNRPSGHAKREGRRPRPDRLVAKRDGPLHKGGGFYHKSIRSVVDRDGDTLTVLTLAKQAACAPCFPTGRRRRRSGQLYGNEVRVGKARVPTNFAVRMVGTAQCPLCPPTHRPSSPSIQLHRVFNHAKSIPPINSERSTSAAVIAAIVCRNVLTFDPSDTVPPSTAAIDPIAVT